MSGVGQGRLFAGHFAPALCRIGAGVGALIDGECCGRWLSLPVAEAGVCAAAIFLAGRVYRKAM